MANVRLELIQDQFHSSGRSEEAEISLATMPPDNLIKPVKENLGAGGNDGLLMSRVPECTSVSLRLTRLRRQSRAALAGTFDLLLQSFESFLKVLFDKVPREEEGCLV